MLCLAIGWSAIGCARFQPFRRAASPEAHPVPASLPGDIAAVAQPAGRVEAGAADDYVVRVVAGLVTCSGSLIAADQVLTAHHCVTERSESGDPLPREVPAERIRVELGGDYLPWGEVGVRAIVAPTCGYAAGEGDLAILVLERKLMQVPVAKARLDTPPELGEDVEPIGFGRCALTADGIRRNFRSGGAVNRLGAGRFRLEAAICPGDSGGPGLSKHGEVIGVISASVMDSSEQTRGLSEFIRLDRWRSLFSNAKLVAEGTSLAELPPVDCAEPSVRRAKRAQ